jgi:hypothetical protein
LPPKCCPKDFVEEGNYIQKAAFSFFCIYLSEIQHE